MIAKRDLLVKTAVLAQASPRLSGQTDSLAGRFAVTRARLLTAINTQQNTMQTIATMTDNGIGDALNHAIRPRRIAPDGRRREGSNTTK